MFKDIEKKMKHPQLITMDPEAKEKFEKRKIRKPKRCKKHNRMPSRLAYKEKNP
jgi:hypothetical protein